MSSFQRSVRFLSIITAILIAFSLGCRAVRELPIDYDEDDYLRPAQEYAIAIAAHDWAGLTRHNYRPEHPPLAKIVYGFVLSRLPEEPEILDRPTTATPPAHLRMSWRSPPFSMGLPHWLSSGVSPYRWPCHRSPSRHSLLF